MIIYKITNLINFKIYIGQDSNNNPDYFGSGILIKKAIKKYGKENFRKDILEYCSTIEELNEREKFWIKLTRAQEFGYNIAFGSNGGNTYVRSIKQNKNMSKIMSGKKHPLFNKRGENNPNFGSKRSEKTKQKISNYHKNRTIEHKIKIVNTRKNNGSYICTNDKKKILSKKCSEYNWIKKENICKKVHKSELDIYLNNGWIIGRIKTW